MNKSKLILITGFALFSMFFGAGNLILPPFLGFQAGSNWFLVIVGFAFTAVLIPILGIMAHAKLQGTMFDFGKKVSPLFSSIYCIIVYVISAVLPAPRTASVTYEMAIQPFFEVSSIMVSTIYFVLVFIFVLNRSNLISIIGKFLTPLIVFILLLIIVIGIIMPHNLPVISNFEAPLVSGLLEGYQTFDAIGAVVVGGVIIISLNVSFKEKISFAFKKEVIRKSGFIAGAGLLLIYGGLIFNGALFSNLFTENNTRSEVLSTLSIQTLGNIGAILLSVLIALACFTTAVGIVTGVSDYFKGVFGNKKAAYITAATISCLLGIVIGQLDVHYILDIALPVLMFIYPITIVLILLNLFSEKFASEIVFKGVVLIAFIFSIPDFLKFLIHPELLEGFQAVIPLSEYSLGWVIPTVLTFVILNFKKFKIA
jgi:LIVCS family branched-chain amino acid:cation transporter